jgi:hypothetical protein
MRQLVPATKPTTGSLPNLTLDERMWRDVSGVVVSFVAVSLLAGSRAVWALLTEAAFLAAGLYLVGTSTTGYCPLYRRLGRVVAATTPNALEVGAEPGDEPRRTPTPIRHHRPHRQARHRRDTYTRTGGPSAA